MGRAACRDVGLMAHVGYDIADIGPFLDQLEAQARRLCVAVMGESAMTTVATLYWHEIHGEPRVRLPALPELLVLLAARGQRPGSAHGGTHATEFASRDEAHAMARRQLWLGEGSEKDARLRRLVDETVTERDGRFAFEWRRRGSASSTWRPTGRCLLGQKSVALGTTGAQSSGSAARRRMRSARRWWPGSVSRMPYHATRQPLTELVADPLVHTDEAHSD